VKEEVEHFGNGYTFERKIVGFCFYVSSGTLQDKITKFEKSLGYEDVAPASKNLFF
jgi:hypothetical protein